MGKKSRSKAAASGSAAGPSSASAAAPSGGSGGGASLAANSAALDLLGSEADITVRLGELLDSIRCRNVLQRLRSAGYSDHVAQRACLEVHQAKREVTYDSAVKWIRRHDITKIDRPLQPLELLRYLSEIVVSLVERLPKPDPAQLQRQLACDLRSSGAAAALLASSSCSDGGDGAGPSGSGASGAGGGSSATSVAVTQSVLASLDPAVSAEMAHAGCSSGPLGQQQWQAELEAEQDILAKLAAADAAGIDLESVLKELGAVGDDANVAAAGPSSAAAAALPTTASTESAGENGSGSNVAAKPASSKAAEEQHQASAAKEVDAASSSSSSSSGAGGGSSSSTGSAGFTERVAQQVLGLQQHMSKAMATLVSLRRSSSGKAAPVGSNGSAPDSVAPADGAAGAAAGAPSPTLDAPSGQDQASGQLSEGQLASLRAMLGPGVEVYTAEEFKQQNPGADYDALPSLDLQLLPQGPATPAGGSAAEGGTAGTAAAAGAAVAADSQSLAAELASLRAHREWADRRIAQLIRRVGDAERPVREEAARLLQEVQALRVDKEGMKSKLRELERSIARIKESSYVEAQQKREFERQAAVAAAELKAAGLREQEAASEAASLQKQLAAERRRREGAEQRCKKAAAEAADAATAAATAAAQQELEALRQQMQQQMQAAEALRAAAGQAEATAFEARARAAATARSELDMLAAEKASLVAALEEAESQVQRAQRAQQEAEQGRNAAEGELAAARQRAEAAEAAAARLQQQLAAMRAGLAGVEARAAAATSVADTAQQQMAQLLLAQQQQQQQRRQVAAPPGGSALSSPDPVPLQPAPAPLAAVPATHGLPSLFGANFSTWSSAGSSSGGSLFYEGRLGAPAAPAMTAVAPAAGMAPHAVVSSSSTSMGSSSGPPSSPLSHSGAATPQHSRQSSSLANSPVALPTSLALMGGPGLGGAGLFAGLPGAPLSSASAAADSLFGGSSSGILLPDPNSIWGAPGTGAGGAASGLPLFAQPH